MTKFNKVNPSQKDVMAEYMANNPSLAKTKPM